MVKKGLIWATSTVLFLLVLYFALGTHQHVITRTESVIIPSTMGNSSNRQILPLGKLIRYKTIDSRYVNH